MRVAERTALLQTFLSIPILVGAVNFNCKDIREQGVLWNLSKLGGPRTVHSFEETGTDQIKNTTFTIDLCKPLKSSSRACSTGARICATESFFTKGKEDEKQKPVEEWPIAGNFELGTGKSINPKFVRLKESDSPGDDGKEGVRISLEGGVRSGGKSKVDQKAVIEFLCDKDKTGLEPPSSNRARRFGKREDEDLPDPDKGQSLQFVSYKSKNEVDVLTLRWLSKDACEDAAKDKNGKGNDKPGDDSSDEGDSNGAWGFFTWFIIVLFLAIAAYLIFGSWLNYNRYGARGWDLLPHGDTIRDVPYLLKEWGRKVISGGGNRGGYNRI